jgi:hypothetical protein
MYKDDHIMEPKTGWGICYAIPRLSEHVSDPRTLEWAVSPKSLQFR